MTVLQNINFGSARNCASYDTDKTCPSNTTLAVAINVFGEPMRQIRECLSRVSLNLPEATVGIFLDGIDRPEVLECAHEFGFLPIMGENLGANATWHLWWLRMFHFFSFTGAAVCFKFDPDTMVDAPPLAIPDSDYFGYMPDGYWFIQGGITGISRRVVRIVLEKRLLEPTAGELRPWLELKENDFADDQALARMLEHIGVYPSRWSECKSLWKEPIANDPVVHAIVHPRYYYD